MIYKILIFNVLLSILVNSYHDDTFIELVKLQHVNKIAFDSIMLSRKFSLADIHEDKYLQNIKYIFKPNAGDSLTNLFRVERDESKIFFGKKQNMFLLVAVSIFTYDHEYYDQLLKECKIEGFYFFGSTTFDLDYRGFKINEFRKEVVVAQFSTGKIDGKDIYRISISQSPK